MANDVYQFLSHPGRYPDTTASVDIVETHISWVFLTDHFVYKLKKPVRFEFLDFSTPEKRHEACQQEVALNRRLAPDVYLDVVPVVRDARGKLQLGGAGRPVDWTVKMTRLSADDALDELIRNGRLDPRDVDKLGGVLAEFYLRLPPVTLRIDSYCQQFEQHVRANQEELSNPVHALDREQIEQVHGAQLRFLHVGRDRLVNRVRDGRIVDGHGDLRPEHIYLTPAPKIIDCVEFSAELRTLDVADELAFLAMECDRLGAGWVGDRIFEYYQRMSGDKVNPLLVSFFKSYRACVRAKVNALRAQQVAAPQSARHREAAEQYLELAVRNAARLGPPVLLLIHGTSGTGKSTLAEAVARQWGARLLQTDVVRREIFDGGWGPVPYGTGKYSPENRRRVYDEMFRRAAKELHGGKTVILDGAFLSRDLRARAIAVAQDESALPLMVHCQCPEHVALERVRDRAQDGTSPSEFPPDAIQQQRREEEPDAPEWPSCHVDTTEGLVGAQQAIDDMLRAKWGL